jgi:hypothetical protein
VPERSWIVPFCVAALLLTGKGQSQVQGVDPARDTHVALQHFQKGKQLIEDNCIDCMGGTQQGMEQGIKEMEAAINAGYRDKKAAYELLSDAYGDMSTYRGRYPEEEKAYFAKRDEVDRKIYALYPNDPEVLDRYAQTVHDDNAKIEILRRLLKIKASPENKFELGYLLLKQRNVAEGLPLVRSAIETETSEEAALNYVGTLISQLQELGCPLADGTAWNEKAQAAFYKATRGVGDPTAMPEFRKNFFTALDKANCKVA